MMITLRPLTVTDEPFLWEMLYHAIYVPNGEPPVPRAIVQQPGIRCYVEGWGRPGDMGVVALDGERPVGAAWLRLWPGKERGYGYLDAETPELSIALLPGYRGKGLGTRLLTQLFEDARACFLAISLSVSTNNPARYLYERLGFERLTHDGSSLLMVKRLPGK